MFNCPSPVSGAGTKYFKYIKAGTAVSQENLRYAFTVLGVIG